MIKSLGLTYDIANNGKEAIEKVQAYEAYELVLMDVQMPVLDGIEATKLITLANAIRTILRAAN